MSGNSVPPPPPAGYYDDGTGQQRYWDGQRWAETRVAPPTRVPPAAAAMSGPSYDRPPAPVEPQAAPSEQLQGGAKPRSAALGTWASVLGITGTVFAFIPTVSGFGITLGVVALVLGIIGLARKGTRSLAGTILGGVALLFGIVFASAYGVVLSGSSSPVAAPVGLASSAPSETVPAKESQATSSRVTPTKPPAPKGTAEQLQALLAAKSYLADGQGFSQAGLLQQLTSQYGNGFAQADAQWAIDNSGADWNAQALVAAKGYLSDGQGFSQAGLIAQLTSTSGNGFTQDQAQYGVDNAGADWNAQAVEAAKAYIATGMGFSRQSLIDQLTSAYGSQFTEPQAEYAASQVGLN